MTTAKARRRALRARSPCVAAAVAAVLLLAGAPRPAVSADRAEPSYPRPVDRNQRGWVVWEDDLESGAPGWTHGDDSYQPVRFHVDTYLAYDDPDHETDYSWWCGVLDPEYAGGAGYGNSWNQWLQLPPIDLEYTAVVQTTWGAIKGMYRDGSMVVPPEDDRGRSVVPVLSFRYRCDTEAGYDYVWIEVHDGHEWVAINDGYNGSSAGWQTTDPGGYDLTGCPDPVDIRFHFVSDDAYSDEDGYYISDGGAFHVDDIRLYDANTGDILYWEDCEGGVGLSQPATVPAAGDYWHLADGECQAYSGTRYWTCCHPDSASVPPNLQNWLQTPVIDVGTGPADACTLYFVKQMFMPSCWGGSWQELSTADGGATWTRTGWWFGDQCAYGYGPCEHFLGEVPVIWWGGPQGHLAAARWVMLTDADGNFPDPSCPYDSAGLTIDDTWMEVWYY